MADAAAADAAAGEREAAGAAPPSTPVRALDFGGAHARGSGGAHPPEERKVAAATPARDSEESAETPLRDAKAEARGSAVAADHGARYVASPGVDMSTRKRGQVSFKTAQDFDHVLRTEYIETSVGAQVSSKAKLHGPSRIKLQRKVILQPGVVVRGDLADVKIEKLCFIGAGTVLRPPHVVPKKDKGHAFIFARQVIRHHTTIGRQCVVEALSVGNNCVIGDDCVIGKRCVLHEFSQVDDGAVLPADTVVPPFGIMGGAPATLIGFVQPSATRENGRRREAVFDKLFPRQE